MVASFILFLLHVLGELEWHKYIMVSLFIFRWHPLLVECLVCSSDWLNATQPNFYREPTKVELELYQELEELERGSNTNFVLFVVAF